ncbi:hypothetical protein ACFVH6_32490 [Spirillospora sp. NPDC127200]
MLTSSILGLLSNQSTACGRHDEAVELAHAAQRAVRNGPPLVRALAAARGNLATAAVGDARRFQQAIDDIAAMLQQSASAPTPAWAYYVTPTELDAITGRGLVMVTLQTPRLRARLLPQAERRLLGRAVSGESAFGRSGLRHAAWLSLAYTHAGQLEQAAEAGHHALDRLPEIRSARSRDLLSRLRRDLAPHTHHHPVARSLVRRLDTQLKAPIST